MNTAQVKTLQYWNGKYPELMQQAIRRVQDQQAGFGQTSDFSSIMGNLTNLLQSYGQYRIASDVANSGTSANRGVVNLPVAPAGTKTINWVLVGGVGLLAVVGILIFVKRKR